MKEKDIILKAENISKQYRLGLVGTGTISHDLNRWWHIVRGKADPYLKVGESNDRSTKGESQYVWALQDVNFEVRRGEVLGIIGKNGAGKSTLLKILSKVTGPTTGEIKTKGRIASLLEVGTGFHGEMTGRENVYLNGAILGMTKKEISSKIDEIIEFSGCQRYIDTPVKRYSSGMTVRLAFAVAAFLEPEILVIDEVLAVGDAEFQKKAIGKMQDISRGDGRTVLFVSHNMAAVEQLCTRGMVLSNGKIAFSGSINEAVSLYRNEHVELNTYKEWDSSNKTKSSIKSVAILNKQKKNDGLIDFSSPFYIKVIICVKNILNNPIVSVRISNSNNINIVVFRTNDYTNSIFEKDLNSGQIELTLNIDNLNLLNDIYNVSFGFSDGKEVLNVFENAITFEVVTKMFNEKYSIPTKEKSTNSILFHEANWKVNYK
jgi:lipopolysaccharide transport system ATP-binding protein